MKRKTGELLLLAAGGAVGLIYFGGLFRSGGRATALTYGSDLAVFLLAGLAAVRIFLPAITLRLRDRWRRQLRGQFCDFASALTNALAGGMNISQALQSAQSDLSAQYAPDAYISLELQEILDGVNNNIPVETMLEDFGARSGIADIASFATVFSTCYRTGGNIRAVVRRTTEIISEKMMISSEIETALTSNKVQMYAMNLLPVGLILLMLAPLTLGIYGFVWQHQLADRVGAELRRRNDLALPPSGCGRCWAA